jgi:hypothetical protein
MARPSTMPKEMNTVARSYKQIWSMAFIMYPGVVVELRGLYEAIPMPTYQDIDLMC